MRDWFAQMFPTLAGLDLASWIAGLLAAVIGLSCLMAFVVIAIDGPLICENFSECIRD